jgi:hypothetical protein
MDMNEVILNCVAVQEMRIVKIFYSSYYEQRWGKGSQFAWISSIVAYLLTEIDLGTGGGNFGCMD